MIENSNCVIERLVVHQMGAKAEGGQLRISRHPIALEPDDAMHDLLRLYFFRPFNTDSYYNLSAEGGAEQNAVFQMVSRVFDDSSALYDVSVMMAERLFEASNHPKIRGGEFYLTLIRNVVVDGQVADAVGIFKSESKETFLKILLRDEQQIELGHQEGINIKRLDKGCIVFNIEREDGYRVCAVDNINRGSEAQFWMEDFLGLKPREDNYFYTDNYLKMCKGFVRDVFNQDNHATRAEQIDLLNKSIGYFQNNPKFNAEEFEQNVIAEPQIISAWTDYKDRFQQEQKFAEPLPTDFDVSKDAVKTEKKNFKSVIKLDKNFHVYVHGSRYYMEKGYDEERDMNFYKLFFRTEE